jgi:hypothetical protein
MNLTIKLRRRKTTYTYIHTHHINTYAQTLLLVTISLVQRRDSSDDHTLSHSLSCVSIVKLKEVTKTESLTDCYYIWHDMID